MATSNALFKVATVPTVYGIETTPLWVIFHIHVIVATVPTVYGIETFLKSMAEDIQAGKVATVPTVYGIETKTVLSTVNRESPFCCNSTYRLRY